MERARMIERRGVVSQVVINQWQMTLRSLLRALVETPNCAKNVRTADISCDYPPPLAWLRQTAKTFLPHASDILNWP